MQSCAVAVHMCEVAVASCDSRTRRVHVWSATDSAEQQRYNLPAETLAAGFELAGLGEMAEACADSDRVIEF